MPVVTVAVKEIIMTFTLLDEIKTMITKNKTKTFRHDRDEFFLLFFWGDQLLFPPDDVAAAVSGLLVTTAGSKAEVNPMAAKSCAVYPCS
mmetsp:Transcript_1803/g.2458  ORF Transcript_1803/g.2458 Transcript_1803/m.2458 type:complete len:90 (+) Transcript_1803:346-615(+)